MIHAAGKVHLSAASAGVLLLAMVAATALLQFSGYCAARGVTTAYAVRLLGAGIATTGAFLLAFAT